MSLRSSMVSTLKENPHFLYSVVGGNGQNTAGSKGDKVKKPSEVYLISVTDVERWHS